MRHIVITKAKLSDQFKIYVILSITHAKRHTCLVKQKIKHNYRNLLFYNNL